MKLFKRFFTWLGLIQYKEKDFMFMLGMIAIAFFVLMICFYHYFYIFLSLALVFAISGYMAGKYDEPENNYRIRNQREQKASKIL